jgi:hypothetical protein
MDCTPPRARVFGALYGAVCGYVRLKRVQRRHAWGRSWPALGRQTFASARQPTLAEGSPRRCNTRTERAKTGTPAPDGGMDESATCISRRSSAVKKVDLEQGCTERKTEKLLHAARGTAAKPTTANAGTRCARGAVPGFGLPFRARRVSQCAMRTPRHAQIERAEGRTGNAGNAAGRTADIGNGKAAGCQGPLCQPWQGSAVRSLCAKLGRAIAGRRGGLPTAALLAACLCTHQRGKAQAASAKNGSAGGGIARSRAPGVPCNCLPLWLKARRWHAFVPTSPQICQPQHAPANLATIRVGTFVENRPVECTKHARAPP